MKQARAGTAAFRPRARLMKLIGAELISDEVVAVVELVKNAHDADATLVEITFNGVTEAGGSIIVEDNGHGMDRDALLGRWMEPAGAWKRRSGGRSPGGRRYLGEKGVGRFAADKLAAMLEITSTCAGSRDAVRATVDWDRFENDERMLSDVRCQWSLRAGVPPGDQGTTLTLSRLRTAWNERMFRRLTTRLARLVPPLSKVSDFCVLVESDEFPDYAGALETAYLDRSSYRVHARYDGQSTVRVKLGTARREPYAWPGRELRCGPVEVTLHAFDLDALARVGPVMDVRAWLKQWRGISVYRDGFRVWPYGEPHDDWLRLDQRRVNNPVLRLSNNQLVGFVEISSDENPELRDQTSREGLIQNRPLADVRRLVTFVLQLLEAARHAVRHPKTAAARVPVSETAGGAWEELEGLVQAVPDALGKRLGKAVQALRTEEADRQQQLMESSAERDLVAQLSGRLIDALAGLRSASRDLKAQGELRKRLRLLDKDAGRVQSHLDVLMAVQADGQPGYKTADVRKELENFKELATPLLNAKEVHLGIRVEGGLLRINTRPELLLRLLFILTTNALDWIEQVEKRKIQITARSKGKRCEITVSDSGPGIPPSCHERVFEPFFTTKTGGRGLGLAVARGLVSSHRGQMAVLPRTKRGTRIRFDLPRRSR